MGLLLFRFSLSLETSNDFLRSCNNIKIIYANSRAKCNLALDSKWVTLSIERMGKMTINLVQGKFK